MPNWIEDAFVKYGWIWIGLSFGFAAKYALLLKRGVPIRPMLVLADILLLPMVALIAYIGANKLGAVNETSALFSSLCAVGADRLVKLLTERFLQRVESEIGQTADRVRGKVRQEVQAELSGRNIIEDTMQGKAPKQYEALRPHPTDDRH